MIPKRKQHQPEGAVLEMQNVKLAVLFHFSISSSWPLKVHSKNLYGNIILVNGVSVQATDQWKEYFSSLNGFKDVPSSH